MRIFTIHNCGFMGPMREPESTIDGHYKIALKKDKFAILSINGYSNFTSIGKDIKVERLNDSSYRFLHDSILYHLDRCGCNLGLEDDTEVKGKHIWYSYKNKPISANLHWSDKIINVKENRIINNIYSDISYINRNPFYQLVDRPELNPKPITRRQFIDVVNTKKEKLFVDNGWYWKTSQEPNKQRFGYIKKRPGFKVNIDGLIYQYEIWQCAPKLNSSRDTYIIKETLGDQIRYIENTSNISAPYHNAIDLLLYKVWRTDKMDNGFYGMYEIESDLSEWIKDEVEYKCIIMEDSESLEYTRKLWYL